MSRDSLSPDDYKLIGDCLSGCPSGPDKEWSVREHDRLKARQRRYDRILSATLYLVSGVSLVVVAYVFIKLQFYNLP